ncbi:MacS family sensor histidine kinase [Streptomyces orinoci]|uniref:Oxygen sensor histidine kinase NreB n=1 Tax=Streptomyces orinoci TaxID=67339 RepID=A0ABV3JWG9_STRON|nr:DUF5931 domain-containing protein [Streptomyces orinoci]
MAERQTRPGRARMSVELPLWRALTGYRLVALGYALLLFVPDYHRYAHPLGAALYLGVLTAWTLATWRRFGSAERCAWYFPLTDLALALAGILLTGVLDTQARIADGCHTLPAVWTSGAALGCALKGGWRWAAAAATLVVAANVAEREELPVRDLMLVWVAAIAIGYVVEVTRISERTLAQALRIEAATRERERLARDIHDNVLQVLAMVQRRGTALGGEAAELGRMAGEQEIALRTLVAGGPGRPAEAPSSPDPAPGASGASDAPDAPGQGPCDLRTLLGPRARPGVSLATPGTPVLLDATAAAELAAAVGAALDNVERHAGDGAQAWILVEDEPDEVIVTVRDDGPGIPEGRLAAAEREGRMGVALSIRGRLAELGGSAELLSVPGQGTEVELRVPRRGPSWGSVG